MDIPSTPEVAPVPQVGVTRIQGRIIMIPLVNCTRGQRIAARKAVQMRLKKRAKVELRNPGKGSMAYMEVIAVSKVEASIVSTKLVAVTTIRQSLARRVDGR